MLNVSVPVGKFIILGPITGLTDVNEPAPITNITIGGTAGSAAVMQGTDSVKMTGVHAGTYTITVSAKNALNQAVSETVNVTVTELIASKLNIPVSPPQ